MSKRTPGPFFFDQMICRLREDESLQPMAIPAAALTMRDVFEMVGLLNKGTHFDDMLEALKEARDELFGLSCCVHAHASVDTDVLALVEAAIAKAEGAE